LSPKGRDSPRKRREALAEKLEDMKIDLVIISNPKHIFYFTGIPSNLNMYLTLMKGPRSTSFLAIRSDGQSSILVGESEISNPWLKESAKTKNSLKNVFPDGEIETYPDYDPNKRVVVYADYLTDEFSKWLGKLDGSPTKIGIEDWHLGDLYLSAISGSFGAIEKVGISKVILSMRKTKGNDEIQNLENATGMLDFAYRWAKHNSKVGKSEVDVYREVNYNTFKEYGPFGWVIGDHISGERSLGVGGWATNRVLKRGDTLILDLQAASNNYWSDLCRTFVVGERKARKEQKHVADTLIKSLEKAEEIMKPGVTGKEIFSAVNNVITSAGYPKILHHVGHSIGLDDQEPPWFIPSSEEEITEGSVVVVEPGIYERSAGGVRIEDAYVITKKGNERISQFPRGLT
jgi:Xaa-Pro aminopeptidase